MEYRTLGRTGIRVSTIALGCEGFMHKTAEEVKADFDFAIENGINFVDIYSSNPDLRLGERIHGLHKERLKRWESYRICLRGKTRKFRHTRSPMYHMGKRPIPAYP